MAKPERGYFDVEAVLFALARAAACRADLSEDFGFWRRAAEPLEHVRSELGIAAAEAR